MVEGGAFFGFLGKLSEAADVLADAVCGGIEYDAEQYGQGNGKV